MSSCPNCGIAPTACRVMIPVPPQRRQASAPVRRRSSAPTGAPPPWMSAHDIPAPPPTTPRAALNERVASARARRPADSQPLDERDAVGGSTDAVASLRRERAEVAARLRNDQRADHVEPALPKMFEVGMSPNHPHFHTVTGAGASERRRARERSRLLAEQSIKTKRRFERVLEITQAQGTIKRFVATPHGETFVPLAAPVKRGAIDPRIAAALPPAVIAEIRATARREPQKTAITALAQPKRTVDRTTLAFGKDRTSLFFNCA